MQLWKKLYSTIWLAFFACVLVPRWMGAPLGLPVHGILGLLLLFLVWSNAHQLQALQVPDRLKRIIRVTKGLAIFQFVSGLGLGALRHLAPDLPAVPAVVQGIHIVCALAILAQASSVATAYDMYEEKEYE